MATKLEKYNQKRDFKKTAEPAGKVKEGKGDLVFVIQKHDASHLHYDFRLEAGGVLISWAIPKEPIHDPTVKRLAMHVEDHPFDYLHFEGTIPQGQYGGGIVMVWDTGTYNYVGTKGRGESEKAMAAALHKGHVTIILKGKKMKGEFTLIKLHGKDSDKDQWLFFKVDKDQYTNRKIPKKDVSVLTGRTMEEISKSNKHWNSNRPEEGTKPSKAKTAKEEIKEAVEKRKSGEAAEKGDDLNEVTTSIKLTKADLKGAKKAPMPHNVKPMLAKLMDGPFDLDDWLFEIKYDGYRAVAELDKGKVELYSRNSKSFNTKYPDVVKALEQIKFNAVLDGEVVIFTEDGKPSFQLLQQYEDNPQGQLVYVVFDILWYEGQDLRQLPLLQRKEILKKVLPVIPGLKYSDHVVQYGKDFFNAAVKLGLEGIMAKKADSIYDTAHRSDAWQKIKNIQSQEAIICGYSEPQRSRKHFGSLVLGIYKGKELVYAGNVGTGFTDKMLKELKEKMDPLIRKTKPFKTFPESERGITWVEPKLVCDVNFTEWTETGSMRHPSFIGLRDDKPATKIKKEPVLNAELVVEQEEGGGKVKFTNTDKIFFPEDGYTKGDIIKYYSDVAEYILPYLIDRPESLRRNPNGINEESFFQKNMDGKAPKWAMTKKIRSKSKEAPIEYLFCQDKDTLMYLANQGCIELNPWSSRIPKLDNPDYIIFDLDPLEIPFKEVIKVAKEVQRMLEELEVTGFIKTSGGKGIHIFVPAGQKYTYEQTQQFAKLIELEIHHKLPNITSLERMPAQRKKKVYLDFLQNAKGKTMASVYSVRPKKGATVSTPLEWKELGTKNLDPSMFTIKTAPERFAKVGDLWDGIFDQGIDLMKVLERFNSLYR